MRNNSSGNGVIRKTIADSDKMAIIPITRNRHKGPSRSNTYKAYTKFSLD